MTTAGRLESALTRLSSLESRHPILSLYLNLAPERVERRSVNPRVHDLLSPIENLASSGELDHDTSMTIRAGVRRALEMTPEMEELLGKGVGLFLCEPLGLEERLTMPREVWDCAIAGPTPYLRPLRAVLQSYRKIAAAVLDSRRAEITVFHMGEVLDRIELEGEELRKTSLSGWYGLEEYRHRQHGEEARHRLFREVAEELSRLRRDHGIDLVFLGGQKETTSALLPFLDRDARELSETFVIDLHTLTPAKLASRVAQLEKAQLRSAEQALVEEVYSLAESGGLGATGLAEVIPAANRNAVSLLLIDHAVTFEGTICPACGAMSPQAAVCPVCNEKTDAVPDLFEALARAVVESGGSVVHVATPLRLTEDRCAARLRYAA